MKNEELNVVIKVTILAILAVLIIIFWPLAIIWALNTLFSLTININFWTWLSVVILNISLASSAFSRNND